MDSKVEAACTAVVAFLVAAVIIGIFVMNTVITKDNNNRERARIAACTSITEPASRTLCINR